MASQYLPHVGQEPFFAATYIPKHASFGRLGLIELTQRISELWKNERERLISPARQVLDALQKGPEAKSERLPGPELLDSAYLMLEHAFDPEFGGFGQAPKFPSPTNLLFLLRYHARAGEEKPLLMVLETLKEMRLGGIYDHLGFGFHRYATDRAWRAPHFEKMLYDQALLSYAYIEAFRVSKDPLFARTAQETISYVLSCLTSKEGAFWSAQDADSEGEEGKYYLFEASEIEKSLSLSEAAFIKEIFGIKEEGNFLEPVSQAKTGKKRAGPSNGPAGCTRKKTRHELGSLLEDARGHPPKAAGLSERTYPSNDRRQNPFGLELADDHRARQRSKGAERRKPAQRCKGRDGVCVGAHAQS